MLILNKRRVITLELLLQTIPSKKDTGTLNTFYTIEKNPGTLDAKGYEG